MKQLKQLKQVALVALLCTAPQERSVPQEPPLRKSLHRTLNANSRGQEFWQAELAGEP
jgi:hypothetical protein